MAEKGKTDLSPQKISLKLSPALGDWTTYRPPRQLLKKIKVGLYGFDRLSEEELKEMHLLHYRFGEAYLSALKVNLHLGGELYSVESCQNSYANFIKSFSGPIFQGKIQLPALHEEIFISFDLPLANTLINAALGGHETKFIERGLTEAENLILETAITEYLSSFSNVFQGVLGQIKFEVVGSPDLTPHPSLNPSGTFVYFSLELTLAESQGNIIIGYPALLIKSLYKKFKAQAKPTVLNLKLLPREILSKLTIPAGVILGKTELTAGEIKNLEIGDVVMLDNSIQNALTLLLSDIPLSVQPGTFEEHTAVRILGGEKEKEIRVQPPVPAAEEKKKAPAPAPALKPAAAPAPSPAVKPPPLPPKFAASPLRPVAPPPPPKMEEEELEEEEFPEEDFDEEDEEFSA